MTQNWQKGFQPELRRQLQANAYHESGHAAVGYACGFVVRKVTLQPRSMTREEYDALPHPAGPFEAACAFGEADIDYSPAFVVGQPKNRSSLKLWVISMLAGELAQMKAKGVASGDGEHDRAKVNCETMKLVSQEELDPFLESMKAQTQDLLDNKVIWAALRACAALLLKKGTITGDDLEQVANWKLARDVAVHLASK
jgi:ATP-dependent Zn protease